MSSDGSQEHRWHGHCSGQAPRHVTPALAGACPLGPAAPVGQSPSLPWPTQPFPGWVMLQVNPGCWRVGEFGVGPGERVGDACFLTRQGPLHCCQARLGRRCIHQRRVGYLYRPRGLRICVLTQLSPSGVFESLSFPIRALTLLYQACGGGVKHPCRFVILTLNSWAGASAGSTLHESLYTRPRRSYGFHLCLLFPLF